MTPNPVRTVTAVATAMAIAAAAAPPAGAARIDFGSGGVDIPDTAPVVVPVPAGSEAAPLPALPYPLVWSRDHRLPGHAPVGNPFDGRTVVLDCASSPQRMPDTIIIACGDGNGLFRNIHWTSWRNDRAEGTAEKVWVDCTPSCHRGTPRSRQVSIALHDVRHTAAGATFASLTSYDDRGARTVSLPGFPYRGDWMFP